MADMDPASLPSVFEGVSATGGDVSSAPVVGVRPDGERAIGEAVYKTPAGAIGLRSGWFHDATARKADQLENCEPASCAPSSQLRCFAPARLARTSPRLNTTHYCASRM